jgi:hypothetical protein
MPATIHFPRLGLPMQGALRLRAQSCIARGKISSIPAHKLDVREYAKSQCRIVMESDAARRIAVSGLCD